MQTVTPEKLEIRISQANSPVPSPMAWQIESFLLKILEYGDYSFRKALTGQLDSRLQCTFFTVKNKCNILAAAASLYSVDNPAIAILGPVCTVPEYRKEGLSFQVCEMLLEHLKTKRIQAVYLGVKDNLPAVNLYKKLGFTNYNGIVMRKLFVSKNKFNRRYLPNQQTIARKMDWQDFAEVSALLCEPSEMYRFDFERHLFSAGSSEVERFLPVFPGLMNSLEKTGGYGSILQTREQASIVGTAFIEDCPSKIQSHIAFLDFFVLDGFWERCKEWIRETIKQSGLDGNRTILCCCPNRHIHKKNILLSLGAEPYAALPDFIRINDTFQDTIIYKLMRKL